MHVGNGQFRTHLARISTTLGSRRKRPIHTREGTTTTVTNAVSKNRMVSNDDSSAKERQEDNGAGKNCVKRKRSSGAHSSLKRQRVSLEGNGSEDNFKTVKRALPEGMPRPEPMEVEREEGAPLPVRKVAPVSVLIDGARRRHRRSLMRYATAKAQAKGPTASSSVTQDAEGSKENVPPMVTQLVTMERPIAPKPLPTLMATRITREITRETPKPMAGRLVPTVRSMSVAAISAAVNQAAKAPDARPRGSGKLVRIGPVPSKAVASAPTTAVATPKRQSRPQQQQMPSPVSKPDEHLAAAVLQGLAPEATVRNQIKSKLLANHPGRKALVERKQLTGTISQVQRTTNHNQTETVTITITRPLTKLATLRMAKEGAAAKTQQVVRPIGACLQPVAVVRGAQQGQSGLSRFRMKTVKAGELSAKDTTSKCLTYVFR